jgi:calcineurin-like phosphoesterase family protein
MHMIWFTSDTHFGHSNVLEFTKRPWKSIDEMNRAIVANINSCVGPRDELWVLGDFSFKINALQAATIRKRILCQRVHLVPGNHDKDWRQSAVAGNFIVEPPIVTLKVDGTKFILSHYPLEDWPSMSHGSIHLHGHIHSEGSDYNEVNRMQGVFRYDVGVDANGYGPVSLDQVRGWFEGVEQAGRTDWRDWVLSTNNEEARRYVELLRDGEGHDS